MRLTTAATMVVITALGATVSACARKLPAGVEPTSHSIAVTSGGPAESALFLERVDSGVVVIDLGWYGADDALKEGLSKIGTTTDDVIAVFLTHSHRDHIAAWKTVAQAPFFMGAAEAPLLFGEEQHKGWVPRTADRLNKPDLPARGDIDERPFARDTFYAFGRDTLRAFLVPGHTAGSAVYLFRGKLFAGDAISETWRRGFVPALPVYSEDTDRAGRSLRSLRARLAPYVVNTVCTAHLECARADEKFWADVLKDAPAESVAPDTAAGAVAVATRATAIVTDTTAYVLQRDGKGWGTRIGYTFHNAVSDTIYGVNCNGAISMAVERKSATGWTTFWAPLVNGCLSPPIKVAPGDSVQAQLDLWGAPPGGNVGPAFADTTFDGTYRLIWWNIYTHYDPRRAGFGDTVPVIHRVSNEFTLRPARTR